MTRPVPLSAVRGASRLVVEATIGLTELVETMHANVTGLPRHGARAAQRTRGITGFVYRNVRRVTRWVGVGVDAGLNKLAPVLESRASNAAPASSLEREAMLAVLNGVVGDHLEASGNPLAIPMEFRRDGRELAERLEAFLNAWPEPVTELVVLAHSQGGLVMRSACHVAEAEGFGWRNRLRRIVFLGTPHQGAPLERGGNWLNLALGATSYTAAFARLGRLRSAGITDLRYGQVVPAPGENRFARGSGRAPSPPLPRGVACFAAAATLAPGPGRPAKGAVKALLGDGLVPVASALGDHRDPARALAIPADRRWIGYGMGHLDLLDRAELYEQIRAWLSEELPA
jgi:hypothetical protein